MVAEGIAVEGIVDTVEGIADTVEDIAVAVEDIVAEGIVAEDTVLDTVVDTVGPYFLFLYT